MKIVMFALGVAIVAVSVPGCSSSPETTAVSEPESSKPSGPPKFSESLLDPQIVPLANGGAYLIETYGSSVWYLHGDKAELVTQVKKLPQADSIQGRNSVLKPAESFWFAQYLKEKKARQDVEMELSDAQDSNY